MYTAVGRDYIGGLPAGNRLMPVGRWVAILMGYRLGDGRICEKRVDEA